jgi:hypothetical protein
MFLAVTYTDDEEYGPRNVQGITAIGVVVLVDEIMARSVAMRYDGQHDTVFLFPKEARCDHGPVVGLGISSSSKIEGSLIVDFPSKTKFDDILLDYCKISRMSMVKYWPRAHPVVGIRVPLDFLPEDADAYDPDLSHYIRGFTGLYGKVDVTLVEPPAVTPLCCLESYDTCSEVSSAVPFREEEECSGGLCDFSGTSQWMVRAFDD